ncbi:MAG: SsrA-binding protein SmpB [Bdellovibrionota bacterium]|jgi:SsrA-binding protein|nr:SsrA-binding protein SmpB [Bdellovibrionota bacterium]
MGIKIIAKNKRATYDYFLDETFEAGLVLQGTEVKTLRSGRVTMGEAYISVDEKKEAWIYNMNIPQYEWGNINNHEETRKRKLLLNRDEIERLYHQMKAARLTIVPVKIYFKNNRIKMEIALARGKKQHDKRQDKAKKDVERKLQRREYD